MAKKILNVKDLRCPIPVLKAEKMLKKLKIGDILEVLTNHEVINYHITSF